MANRMKPVWDKTKSVAKSVGSKAKEYSKNFVDAAYGDGRALPEYGAAGMAGGFVFSACFMAFSTMFVGLTLMAPVVAPIALGTVAFTTCFVGGYAQSMAKITGKATKNLFKGIVQKTKTVGKNVSSKTKEKTVKFKQAIQMKMKVPSFKKKSKDVSVSTDTVAAEDSKTFDTSKTATGDFDKAVNDGAPATQTPKAKPAVKNTPKPK